MRRALLAGACGVALLVPAVPGAAAPGEVGPGAAAPWATGPDAAGPGAGAPGVDGVEHVVLGGPVAVPGFALDAALGPGRRPARLAGPDRWATAVEVSRAAHPDGADVVHVAVGTDFPDALAAGQAVVAPGGGGALLLTAPDRVPDVVADELARLDPDVVVVVGGTRSISPATRDALGRAAGAPTRRVAGADRYATAAALARDTHPDGADVVHLATGRTPADALAAAGALARDGAALLLADGDVPGDDVAAELRRLAPDELVVLGGTAAVGEALAARAAEVSGATTTTRLAGADRLATAGLLARRAHPAGPPAHEYVVDARGWADALAGAQLVADGRAALRPVETRPLWRPDLAAAVAVGDARAGDVTIAAVGADGPVGSRASTPVAQMSVYKVMLLVAHLRSPAVRDRPLTDADLALLEPMITESANAPATTIHRGLGRGPLEALAAEAGMQQFSWLYRPWGRVQTSAADQARFLLRYDDLVPPRHRQYARDVLTRVVASQRWGVGQVADDLGGWTVRFKGGWGSATGAWNHQVVQLEFRDGTTWSAAVTITDMPDHAYGTETLRLVFEALLAELPRDGT